MTDSLRTPPDVPGYEITRLIGLGGMGEVYLGRQLALNRPVAIKFLSTGEGGGIDEHGLRFRREAELMAGVSHPNIVTIFDFGTAVGRPYLVMEYIEGGDLRSRMAPGSPTKAAEIRAIIRPVIRALEYLHGLGIVHRDMKPENILIHHEETPKVTDFGLAVFESAIGSMTRPGRSMGTPGYVSPEQQYGLKVDERADQFSIAALSYEMATGRRPLGAYPPASKLNPGLGPGADAAIRKGLSEDPADRYPTIGDFGEALDRGLSAPPGRARSARRAGWVAGVGVLLALVAAGSWIAYKGKQPAVGANPPPAAPPDRLTLRTLNMTLALIPEGSFRMGSPTTDNDARGEEFPEHPVRISRPFYLGVHEVTLGQFRAFVAATGHRTTAESDGRGGGMFDMEARQFAQRPDLNWREPGSPRPRSEDEPVVQVSWRDAVAFCEWLTKLEGRTFRLPTEAEWEYACRARTATRWSSGDDPGSVDDFAWTLKNSGGALHRVGTKRANPFGLHDMHGNVWEWCSDRFGRYEVAEAVDPEGPPLGDGRVLRGGSIDWDRVERTRSASRLPYPENMSFTNYGFRVCSPGR